MKTLLGALAVAAGVVLQLVPLWHGLTAPTLVNLCSTGLGHLLQDTSATVARDCGTVRAADYTSWVLLVAGGLFLALGLYRKRPDEPQ